MFQVLETTKTSLSDALARVGARVIAWLRTYIRIIYCAGQSHRRGTLVDAFTDLRSASAIRRLFFPARAHAVLVSVTPRFRSPSLTSPPRKRIHVAVVVVVVFVVVTQVHV